MKTCMHLLALLLVCSTLSKLQAQVDLELRLEAEKSVLLEGEQGQFTFILTNRGMTDQADPFVVPFLRGGSDFEVVEGSVSGNGGSFTGGWSFESLAAGASDTLSFEAISLVPYLHFRVDVLGDSDPNNSAIFDRCGGDPSLVAAFYADCELEDTEVVYPAERFELVLESVVCTSAGPIGCGAIYDVQIQNTSTVASAPVNAFLLAKLGDFSDYALSGSTVLVPSIPAGETYLTTIDFGDCLPDRPFATVSLLRLGLIENPDLLQRLATSNCRECGDLSTVSFVEASMSVDYCQYTNQADIALRLESDGRIDSDGRGFYQVIVTNNGSETAQHIGITYGTNSSSLGTFLYEVSGTSSYSNSRISVDEEARSRFFDYDAYWDVFDLAPGESAVLNAQIRLASFIDSYQVSCKVNDRGTINDPNPSDNSASIELLRSEDVDLTLTVENDRADLDRWEQSTFTFTLKNTGNITATGITVDICYNNSLVEVGSATPMADIGRFTPLQGQEDCARGAQWTGVDIPPNREVSLNLELYAVDVRPSLCAEIVAIDQTEDINFTPANFDCETVMEDDEVLFQAVAPYIDLELSADADLPFIPNTANQVVYTLFSNSSVTAHNAVVMLNLPESAIADGFVPIVSQGNYDPTTGIWDLGDVAPYYTARMELYILPIRLNRDLYAELIAVDETDEDSTPNNGTFDRAIEDDEVIVPIIGINTTPVKLTGDAVELGTNSYQLTPNESDRQGSLWGEIALDLSQDFELEAEIYLGRPNGADGMIFVLQQDCNDIDSPTNSGGDLGFKGITPSLGLEFDTHPNGVFEPAGDHVSIQKNGEVNHRAENTLVPSIEVGELEDGEFHRIVIRWNARSQFIQFLLDGTVIFDRSVGNIVDDIFGGDPLVYWGFTAATGGFSNEQVVRYISLFADQYTRNCSDNRPIQVAVGEAKEGIHVFPNPTQDILQVIGDYTPETNYTIYDVFGKKHYSGQLNSGQLEVSSLPKGTYYIHILDQKGQSHSFVRM